MKGVLLPSTLTQFDFHDLTRPQRRDNVIGMETSMARKIRNLLAHAEGTNNPDEAKTYVAQASRLMDKYSIDQAMIASLDEEQSKKEENKPVKREVCLYRGPYMGPRETLLRRIADTKGVRHVSSRWNRKFGNGTYVMHLVGFPSDVEAVEMLYTSLLVQATRELESDEVVAARKREGAHKTAFTNAFMLAFTDEVYRRIRIQRAEAEKAAAEAKAAEKAEQGGTDEEVEDASHSVALVLADRKALVDQTVDDVIGKVVSTRGSSAGSGWGTGSGYSKGRAAGQRASIGSGRSVSGGVKGSLH